MRDADPGAQWVPTGLGRSARRQIAGLPEDPSPGGSVAQSPAENSDVLGDGLKAAVFEEDGLESSHE